MHRQQARESHSDEIEYTWGRAQPNNDIYQNAIQRVSQMFTLHIAYEHFRLRNTAWPTAWHASVAVAFGAFALALKANIYDPGSASGYRPRMLIALVAWPLLAAVPAFIVALGVAAGLGVKRLRV
jgi:hypothetical protein